MEQVAASHIPGAGLQLPHVACDLHSVAAIVGLLLSHKQEVNLQCAGVGVPLQSACGYDVMHLSLFFLFFLGGGRNTPSHGPRLHVFLK